MYSWPGVPVLEGTLVRLEPLAARHADDLAAAAEEDRGGYGFTLVPRAAEVGGYLDAQFAPGGARRTGIPAPGPAGMIFAPSRSALPGCPHRLRARGSTPKPSSC